MVTEFLNNVHTLLLVKTIYAPYRSHIEKYDCLEEQQLVSSLKTISMVGYEIIVSE